MEATGKVLHIARKMPAARRRQVAPNGVIGVLIFIVAEVMFFGGLISAHTIVRTTSLNGWPPPGQPRLPIQETLINTAALIASGVAMYFAHRAYDREVGGSRAKRPMLAAMLLGLFFVGFQGMEWAALLREGLHLTTSTHAGFFYLIIGAHALHAIAGLSVLAWAYARLMRGELVRSQLLTVEIFWYFVVALWPILYWRVYLA
jgi:heme/copper-type cytochrome/quinol oxidase subunit 3